MATIDLIVLGIVKKEPLSAYDIQKLVEYRNISRWVKISTPSIYKKVIQLEKKGYIRSTMVKEGNMAEKAVYSLTEAGEQEFKTLMLGISTQPILASGVRMIQAGGLPLYRPGRSSAGNARYSSSCACILSSSSLLRRPLRQAK